MAETFVGGHTPGGQGGKGKAIVMGMMEKGGDVITEVIPDRKSNTLMNEIVKMMSLPQRSIQTNTKATLA